LLLRDKPATTGTASHYGPADRRLRPSTSPVDGGRPPVYSPDGRIRSSLPRRPCRGQRSLPLTGRRPGSVAPGASHLAVRSVRGTGYCRKPLTGEGLRSTSLDLADSGGRVKR
jgi:hypothetical protein